MTKFLVAAAALMVAQPSLAYPGVAISLTNSESSSGFADLRECEAALRRPATAADQASPGSGSIFNRARGHISNCEEVDGEYLIVVRPAGSSS